MKFTKKNIENSKIEFIRFTVDGKDKVSGLPVKLKSALNHEFFIYINMDYVELGVTRYWICEKETGIGVVCSYNLSEIIKLANDKIKSHIKISGETFATRVKKMNKKYTKKYLKP